MRQTHCSHALYIVTILYIVTTSYIVPIFNLTNHKENRNKLQASLERLNNVNGLKLRTRYKARSL